MGCVETRGSILNRAGCAAYNSSLSESKFKPTQVEEMKTLVGSALVISGLTSLASAVRLEPFFPSLMSQSY